MKYQSAVTILQAELEYRLFVLEGCKEKLAKSTISQKCRDMLNSQYHDTLIEIEKYKELIEIVSNL